MLIPAGFFEPAFKAGGPIQSLSNLVSTIGKEYEIIVLALASDIDHTQLDVQTDTLLDKGNYKIIFLKATPSVAYLYQLFKKNDFDFVYLNSFFSWHFAIKFFLLRFFYKFKIILAPRGQFYEGAMEYNGFFKKLYVAVYNFLFAGYVYKYHATSDAELLNIRKNLRTGTRRIQVISNLKLLKIREENFIHTNKVVNELRIVFFSRIAPKKNLTYAINILNEVREPKIVFDIYGTQEDSMYWKECEQMLKKLPENVTATYCGFLHPDEVVDRLNGYDLFFFPTKGENFGHVLLEAMMAGLPLLISDQTPFKDLEANGCGWSISLSNAESYIKVINEVAAFDGERMLEIKRSLLIYLNTYQKQATALKDEYLELFS